MAQSVKSMQLQLRIMERSARRLQVRMDAIEREWDAKARQLETAGAAVPYRFGDALA